MLNAESRTVSAGKNAVAAITNKICVLFLTFISRKIFIQYIGIEYLGINGLFSNILTLLSMADLGMGTAMNVSLYKPIADNDTRKLSALLNYFRQIYCCIAIAVTVVGLGLIPVLKYIINMDADIPYLYVYYIMFLLKNTVSYLFVYKAAMVSADQRDYLVNKVAVYVNVVKVAAQILTVIILKNYFFYMLLEIAAVVANNFTVSHIADKQYAFLRRHEQLTKEEKKLLFKDIYSAFLYKIAGILLSGTDNILMSVIINTVTVGLYSNYCTITGNIEALIILLFNSLTAGIGNLIVTSASEKRYRTYKSMQMAGFWLAAVISACLLFLTQDFIELWLGKDLLLDNYVLIAIVINIFYSVCMRPIWTFREGTGMYRQIRYIMFITALLNIALSIAFGRRMGAGGILIATSVSKFLTCFWYEPLILYRNFFCVNPVRYYIEYFANVLLACICVIFCYVPIHYVHGVSIKNWLIKMMICFVIINAVYLFRYFKSSEFIFFKEKVSSLAYKKH